MGSGRRLYVYGAALAGLAGVCAAIIGLTLPESGELAAPGGRKPWVVIGVVGLLVWTVHSLVAARAARAPGTTGQTERESSTRKAYLYLGQLMAAGVFVVEGGLLSSILLGQFLTGVPRDDRTWLRVPALHALGLVAGLALWIYLNRTAVSDGDRGHEKGRGGNWRRGYSYLLAGTGFALIMYGGYEYTRVLLGLAGSALTGQTAAGIGPDLVVMALTMLLVGIPLAFLAWQEAKRNAARAPAVEYGALSRMTLLHCGALIGTAAVLASAARLFQGAILSAVRAPADLGIEPGGPASATLVAYLLVGIVAWAALGSAAVASESLGREGAFAAGLRRARFYGVAGFALTAFSAGIVTLLVMILAVVSRRPGDAAPALDLFSLAAAFVLVGAPAWWGHWWPQQARARNRGASGQDERGSLVRKLYLYGIGTSAFLVAAGGAIMVVAGSTATAASSNEGMGLFGTVPLAAIPVALFWGVSHALVIRGDRRLTANLPPDVLVTTAAQSQSEHGSWDGSQSLIPRSYLREELVAAPTEAGAGPILLIDGGDGEAGATLARAVRAAMPGLRIWALGLNAAAHSAMVAALGSTALPVPANAISLARLIAGPSDILLTGSLEGDVREDLVASLATSQARLVLLPPRQDRLRWVAAPDWPLERWVENAVIDIANLVDDS